jgi:quercetin dioxygenase-like cupin family protein
MYVDPSLFTGQSNQLPNVFTPGAPLAWPVINGTIYLFGFAGDVIADHTHPAGQNHIIGVLAGSVTYSQTNADGSVTLTNYAAPAILVVPPELMHSVTALGTPANPSGPSVADPTTLAAITIHLTMSAIQPSAIKAKLDTLATYAQSTLADITTEFTNAINLANGTVAP